MNVFGAGAGLLTGNCGRSSRSSDAHGAIARRLGGICGIHVGTLYAGQAKVADKLVKSYAFQRRIAHTIQYQTSKRGIMCGGEAECEAQRRSAE